MIYNAKHSEWHQMKKQKAIPSPHKREESLTSCWRDLVLLSHWLRMEKKISAHIEANRSASAQGWPPRMYAHLEHRIYQSVIVEITFQAELACEVGSLSWAGIGIWNKLCKPMMLKFMGPCLHWGYMKEAWSPNIDPYKANAPDPLSQRATPKVIMND